MTEPNRAKPSPLRWRTPPTSHELSINTATRCTALQFATPHWYACARSSALSLAPSPTFHMRSTRIYVSLDIGLFSLLLVDSWHVCTVRSCKLTASSVAFEAHEGTENAALLLQKTQVRCQRVWSTSVRPGRFETRDCHIVACWNPCSGCDSKGRVRQQKVGWGRKRSGEAARLVSANSTVSRGATGVYNLSVRTALCWGNWGLREWRTDRVKSHKHIHTHTVKLEMNSHIE